jgi:hypothetical protein
MPYLRMGRPEVLDPDRLCRVGCCLPGGLSVLALLAWMVHLPPSAVPLVGDVRFRSSAQRLARLT